MATGLIKTNKTTYIIDGDTFEPIDEGARAGIASLKEELSESVSDLMNSFATLNRNTSDLPTIRQNIATLTGNVNIINSHKVSMPLDDNDQPTYGINGQVLRTNGEGVTEWASVGLPTDEQTAEAVENWLDDHPEATTSVQDRSLTQNKYALGSLGYVTPEMFGAVGNGTTDDTNAMRNCFSSGYTVKIVNKYKISSDLKIARNLTGNGIIIAEYDATVKPKKITFMDGCNVVGGVSFEGLSLYVDSHNSSFSMTNCEVSHYGNGISVYGATVGDIFIVGNKFRDQLPFLSSASGEFGVFGCISFEASTISGKCDVKNNFIDGTASFGIIFYSCSFTYDFIVDGNVIKNIGANRNPNDTDFSGCCGIYTAYNGKRGQITNNTLININEVGIEGTYNTVEGNYIENTGAFYYKYPIGDNAGIFGQSNKIINNIIYGASGSAGIHSYSPDGNITVSGVIAGNKIINYKKREASRAYNQGDYVQIGTKVYEATTDGATGSEDISDANDTITDGAVTWEYRKRRLFSGISLQNAVGICLIRNIIHGVDLAYNQMNPLNIHEMTDIILNCGALAYANIGYPNSLVGRVILDEDYSFNPSSLFGTPVNGVLTKESTSFTLLSADASAKFKWVNIALFGTFTGQSVVTINGTWARVVSNSSDPFCASGVGGKTFGVTTSGKMELTRILITVGD